MATSKAPELISDPDEVFDQIIAAADEMHLATLEGFARVRAARGRSIERMMSDIGTPETPAARERLASLEDSLKAERREAAELRLEKTRAENAVSKPREGESVVHGRIVDDDLSGVAGAEVSLHDAEGNKVRGAAGVTDKSGAFKIVMQPKLGQPPGEVYVHVSRGRSELHADARPLDLVTGAARYVEILLPEEKPEEKPERAKVAPRKTAAKKPSPRKKPGGRR